MKPEPLTEDELVQALRAEGESACNYYDTVVADQQEKAIEYYDGKPFGDEVEGLSQIVLPDVAEAVDYMTISVLRLFVSGDRVVEFQAKRAEDEDALEEATEAVQQIFMQHQDGYRVMHDWLKSGLIEKIGVVKSVMVSEESVSEKIYLAESEEELALAPDDADITNNGDGTFRVVVREPRQSRYFYDYTVPSEEFRFSSRARHEDSADYLAHVCRKTRSDLVEMGFDVDTVYELPMGDDVLLTDGRGIARDEDYDPQWLANRQASMQGVELWEEYIRIDADGDGIAELLKCFRVGDKLLSSEIVDEHPFTVFCPFPRPHRLVGDGLADKAMDIQRIRSVVARQLMNGMYLSNMPRYWVPVESTTENTISDLLTVIAGAPVRGKGVAPTPLNSGFDIGKSLGVLEFWNGERESRTGITRMNQGLDADTLNKTATGTALMQAQGQQYEEFIARNFAECVSRMFWRKYRLIKDAGEPFEVKIGGTFAQVDPSRWPDEPDMVIRTGLGTNRKDQRIAMRMQLLAIQREGYEIGLTDKETLFNGAAGIVKDMNIGQPDEYFVDPRNAPPQEDQPDPALVEAESKARAKQDETAAKMQLKREEIAADMQVDRERMAQEAQLRREEMATEAFTSANVDDSHPGGSLAA